MAALVAAIRVFGAASRNVDGWAEPSHDEAIPGRHDAARDRPGVEPGAFQGLNARI